MATIEHTERKVVIEDRYAITGLTAEELTYISAAVGVQRSDQHQDVMTDYKGIQKLFSALRNHDDTELYSALAASMRLDLRRRYDTSIH